MERLYIGGEYVESTSAKAIEVENPASEEVIAEVPDASDADIDRAVGAVIHGLTGEITVNGNQYNSVMPALALNDEDVANVMTYVLNTWENSGGEVKPEDVAKIRAEKK